MIAKIVLLAVLVLVVALVWVGFGLVRGSFQPFKDKDGNPTTLSSVEKVTLGVAIGALVVGILAIVLPVNHPWIKRLKGQKS